MRVPAHIVVALVALQAQIREHVGAQRIFDAANLHIDAGMRGSGDPKQETQRGHPGDELNPALVVVPPFMAVEAAHEGPAAPKSLQERIERHLTVRHRAKRKL